MWKRPILAMMIVSILAPAIGADQGSSQGRGGGSTGSGKSGGSDTKKKSGDDSKKGGGDTKASSDVIFNRGDQDTFRDYFRTHRITAEALPPGIAKNVARGKPLPPGIAKKALPNDLVAKLGSRAQPGVTYNIVGDRVVALRAGTVIDVLEGLFR